MRSYVRPIFILIIGMLLGFGLAASHSVWASRNAAPSMPWRQANLFAEVFERVRRDYVEDVSDEQLMSSAVRGVVAGLDPYSTYLDAKEYEEMRVSTSGVYSGVGIELSVEDGTLKVVTAIDDSPAARAGIRSGDTVLSVDNIPADAEHMNDAVEHMRGKPGAHVKLTMRRINVPQPLEFDLVRRKVQMHSVKSQMLEPNYGYLRISQFTETTAADVLTAMHELQNREPTGLHGLVLDLRDNPGGVLEAAVEVADNFLEHGIIVTADGRSADSHFAMQAQAGDLLAGAPITVLVNGGSASASEIVAGALQDNKRALLIGRNTYGKGSVQTVVALAQGGALKLTTSRYHTPSGASISQRGITPDVMLDDSTAAVTEQQKSVAPASLLDDAAVRAALDKLRQLSSAAKASMHRQEKFSSLSSL